MFANLLRSDQKLPRLLPKFLPRHLTPRFINASLPGFLARSDEEDSCQDSYYDSLPRFSQDSRKAKARQHSTFAPTGRNKTGVLDFFMKRTERKSENSAFLAMFTFFPFSCERFLKKSRRGTRLTSFGYKNSQKTKFEVNFGIFQVIMSVVSHLT